MSNMLIKMEFRSFRKATRMRQVLGVLAQHGFQSLYARAGLGRFAWLKMSPDTINLSEAQRLRMAFEKLGPTFIKLGQLLATRPDLLPPEFVQEFKTLQSHAQPVEFEKLQHTLAQHFKNIDQVFKHFDTQPLGTASIAQVHKGVLQNGKHVVVKIQKPGVAKLLQNDMDVLFKVAQLLEKYIEESRPYKPLSIVEHFAKSCKLETNFIVEANNMQRMSQNFKLVPYIKIPHVYTELSGEKVLVMEELTGTPLSHIEKLNYSLEQRQQILTQGMHCYAKMLFTDGMFHGDLHSGNILILQNLQLGLIDFGMVGSFSRSTQMAITYVLEALVQEDYERLAYEYVALAPYSNTVKVEKLAESLRELLSPYHGLSWKKVNMGRLLMDSVVLSTRHGLSLPADLIMFFKSLISIEGLGRSLVPNFNFLSHYQEVARPILKFQYDPKAIAKDLSHMGRDLSAFYATLPRHMRQALRRWSSPESAFHIQIDRMGDFIKSLHTSSHNIMAGLIISGCTVAGSVLYVGHKALKLESYPTLSFISFGVAIFLGLWVALGVLTKP